MKEGGVEHLGHPLTYPEPDGLMILGYFVALTEDKEALKHQKLSSFQWQEMEEHMWKVFFHIILQGELRQAFR